MLVPNETLPLTATPKDAQGNPLLGRVVDWSTSASGIATVIPGGLVTAVAVGTATITATSEGKTAQATITVRDGGFISPAGGTVTAASGNVVVQLPASALAAATAITVTPVANPEADPKLIPGTAYEFGPTGTAFAQPVTLRIKYDAAALPVGANLAQFQIHRLVGTTWTPVAGSTVDVATRTVTGQTSSFSIYAVLELGAPVAIAVGTTHTCARTISNAVYCWGSNAIGGLGDGTTTDRLTPTPVIGGPTFVDIGAGWLYTCGRTSGGFVYCWGDNQGGRLGDGTTVARLSPTLVLGGASFAEISVGQTSACARSTSNFYVACWGYNASGAGLGDGTTSGLLGPTPIANGLTLIDIATGTFHSCGRTALNETYCWGYNLDGAIGDGTAITRLTPSRVIGGLSFVELAAGSQYTCGRTSGNAVYCWGLNNVGQGGDGTTTGRLTPTPVTGGLSFVQIAVGIDHTCGRTTENATYCWGSNSFGQVGSGSGGGPAPVLVAGGHTFVEIAAGGHHTCGRTASNAVYCWGQNEHGELGDGTRTDRPAPTRVLFP
jgi:alpha-tubulin suppressor-like RCC1 family protein